MSINLRLPNVTAASDSGKLAQMQSYMYQLVEQLNWALNNIGDSLPSQNAANAPATGVKEDTQSSPASTFGSIKSLIIKSADIVNAYYDEITKMISKNNLYVAESDFGTFKEATESTLYADGTGLTHQVSSIQTIFDSDGNILDERICDGFINSGILYYDEDANAVVGLEIGQRNTDGDGNTLFKKFARFTSEELSFYDSNEVKVAYISDRRLYIPEAHIEKQLMMGHFIDIVKPNGAITTKYIRRF